MKLQRKDGESPPDKVEIRKLWSMKCKEIFNVLCVGTLFRQNGMMLVTGGEDAVVRCYELGSSGNLISEHPQIILETKSGPIQTMEIYDVTKFYSNDLIVGDSIGALTVICNQQILSRETVSPSSINILKVHRDAVGMSSVIVSNDSGTVSSVQPSRDQWRLNLNSSDTVPAPTSGVRLKVTSMSTAELTDQNGQSCCYVLVADNLRHLYLLNQGEIVMVLTAPGNITAMCQGRFVGSQRLDLPSPGKESTQTGAAITQQVALGTDTGAIHLLHNFAITVDEFANAQNHVTHLATLPRPDADKDLLLCCGQFNKLNIYQDGQSVTEYFTPDWINTLQVRDIDSDGITEAVLGCLDNSVHAVKITS